MNYPSVFDIRILFILFFMFCFSTYAHETETSVELTKKEQAWLDDHQKIVFGGGIFTPVDGVDENKNVTGMARDYVDLVAQKLGVSFEHVSGDWADMHKQVKNREIDGIRLLVPDEKRKEYLNFTDPYAQMSYGFVVRDDEKRMSTLAGLSGKNLATLRASYDQNYIAEYFPEINLIPVDSYEAGIEAVKNTKADAFIGAMIPIEYIINKHGLSSLRISSLIQKFPSHELTIGIRKDWPEFIPILNKAIASITPQDREQIVSKWNWKTENTEADTAFPPSWLVISTIAIFMLLILLAYRMGKDTNLECQFGNVRYRYGLLVGLFLFVIVISLQAWWVLEYNKKQILESYKLNLQNISKTTHERLNIWIDRHKNYLEQFSNNPKLVSITERLLNVKPTKKSLLESEALAEARRFFISKQKSFGGQGFFIINPQYISIGSARDTNVGAVNLIAVHKKKLLERVFKGETLFIPPIETDVQLESSNGVHSKATMFFATPIRNSNLEVIAVLTQRLDPLTDFSTILNFGRLGETGETYAFSKKGLLLSESRFNDQLRKIGLIGADQHSSLSIDIHDPGGDMIAGYHPKIMRYNQPLTKMALSAVAGRSGVDMTGYRDYRGVNVYGVWLWDDKLDFGLATEIDSEEVLSQYYVIRLSIFGVLTVTLVLSIGAILFTLFAGERVSRHLLENKEDLEDLVQKRTSELSKANIKLQELDKLKNTFLVSMSHEIRTPMNAILGFSELLATTDLNDEQKEYLSRAQNATDSLLTLLGDIIDLERIEAGQLNIYNTPSNLKIVVLEVVDLLKLEALKKGLLLESDIDENIPQHLMCDSKRIRQILINLVGNAIKFTRKGSIHIGLHVAYQDEKKCGLEFVVSDTGIGIPQEKQAEIFNIFTQVDDSMTREDGGIGLGLSICKNLLESMGSKIEVESTPGHGTTFSFELVLRIVKSAEDVKPVISTDAISFANFKILLVEDNKNNRDLTTGLLNYMGINVDEAFNGQMALDMIRKNMYDLVFMDIQMPVMDGLTSTRIIREEGYTQIPIIALSAHTTIEEQQRSIEAGMNAHLNKPFKLHDLQTILLHYFPNKAIKSEPLSKARWVEELSPVRGLEFNDELYSYWIDKEHFIAAQERFIKSIHKEAVKINQLLDENDIIGVNKNLHKFKGALKLFGAKRLLGSIQRLEASLGDNIQIDLADLRREFNDAIAEITA